MDPKFASAAIEAAALTVLGYIWQWARSPKGLPNWASWAAMVVACAATFVWATPDWQAPDWRVTGLKLYGFVLAARGFAATSKETKIAPLTNSK